MDDFAYDFTNVPVTDGEQFLDSPGWYRMKLIEKKNDDKLQINLVFQSLGPTHVGAKVTAYIKDPAYASGNEELESWMKWIFPWLCRLGLADSKNPGKPIFGTWKSVIGWEGVGYLEPNSYTDKNGNVREGARFKFCSIYPSDHADIPVIERIRMGLPLLDWQTDPRLGGEPGKKPKATKGGGTSPPVAPTKTKEQLEEELLGKI